MIMLSNQVTVSQALVPPKPSTSTDKHIKTMFNYDMNEEKEKAIRHLDVQVHSVTESSSEDGNTRKSHDTDFVSDMCQQHLSTKSFINKCFRIGMKGTKPRLLKISLNTELEKERQANKNLRAQLKEMNKDSQ